jgi:hypothetical protein
VHASVRANTCGRRGAERGFEQAAVGDAFLQRVGDARGCSWISLSMKCSYWPFSAASAESSLSRTGGRPVLPSRSMMRTAGARDFGDIAFLEEHEAARHGQQRRDIGGDEVLVLPQADARCRAAGASRATMMRVGSCWLMTASA